MPDWELIDLLTLVGIFLARVVDVTIGTLRTILLVRGHRVLAAGLGFVEVLVWLFAASRVLGELDRWPLAVAYAAGFAAGNLTGGWLEARLAIGFELVRIVSPDPDKHLGAQLAGEGHEVTTLEARNRGGEAVEVLLLTLPRRRVPRLIRRVHELDPNAFCTVTEVRHGKVAPPLRTIGRRPGHLPDTLAVSKRK